jgi:hypothetical protein
MRPKLKAVFIPGQQPSNGAERISREGLARRLEERGLPPMVFTDDGMVRHPSFKRLLP